jgi:hypothetical protein
MKEKICWRQDTLVFPLRIITKMNQTEFEENLIIVKDLILENPSEMLKSLTPISFERLVVETLNELLEEKVGYKEGSSRFPDIVIQSYGIEVKLTKSDSWTSTGNSILESTRVEGVEQIYIVFLKQLGEVDIRVRKYEECLTEIAVTHSPRYKIDMVLKDGETIFDKMKVYYDDFRKGSPIRTAKEYYGSKIMKGKERLWWLDEGKEEVVPPVLRNFSGLRLEKKEELRVEIMSLFPEVFGNNQYKFEEPTMYLLVKYNIYSKNIRDEFTAGGKIYVDVQGKKLKVKRIIGECLKLIGKIRYFLENCEEDLLKECWNVPERMKLNNHISEWEKRSNTHCGNIEGLSFSDIVEKACIL